MNLYTRLCVASSAVSFGTVALLLWNSDSSDTSYIYLSLAAPTIILGYHLLYLFNPFFDLDSASYTVVPQDASADTHTSRRNSGTEISRPERPNDFIKTSVSTTSDERNPMVSSPLSILCLLLLTVVVGSIALSAGTVAFLNTIEEASLQIAVERLDAFAAYYNTTTATLEAGVNISNATIKPEFAPIARKMSPKVLTQIIADVAEVSRRAADHTVPPSRILAAQALLSLIQMIFLGRIVIIGMRRRVSRYACDYAEDEEYGFTWTYVEDNADSADEDEENLESQVREYVSCHMLSWYSPSEMRDSFMPSGP